MQASGTAWTVVQKTNACLCTRNSAVDGAAAVLVTSESVQEEGDEDEDPLYEASDIEGGDVGIADEGEMSVPPDDVSDAGDFGAPGFV